MIAAFDVHYLPDVSASGAAVLFPDYSAAASVAEYTCRLPGAAEYVPGEFYKRELPCILKLCKTIKALPGEIVVDGYAMIGKRPGLGGVSFRSSRWRHPRNRRCEIKVRGCTGD